MVKNDGKLYAYKDITDHKAAAKEFAEGSESLEKLLLKCFKMGVVTRACCIGHDKLNMPKILFENTDYNLIFIKNFINNIQFEGLRISFTFENTKSGLGAHWTFEDRGVKPSTDVKVSFDNLVANPYPDTKLFTLLHDNLAWGNPLLQDKKEFMKICEMKFDSREKRYCGIALQYDKDCRRYTLRASRNGTVMNYIVESDNAKDLCKLLRTAPFNVLTSL
jgi:hypothetical protein